MCWHSGTLHSINSNWQRQYLWKLQYVQLQNAFRKNNIEYTITAYVKIITHFAVKCQVANFLQNIFYIFSITWLKQGWIKLWENTKYWKQRKSYVWRSDYFTTAKNCLQALFQQKKSLFNTNFGSAVLLEEDTCVDHHTPLRTHTRNKWKLRWSTR